MRVRVSEGLLRETSCCRDKHFHPVDLTPRYCLLNGYSIIPDNSQMQYCTHKIRYSIMRSHVLWITDSAPSYDPLTLVGVVRSR